MPLKTCKPWLLIAALTLTACASGAPPMPTPTLNPPQADMADCPPLEQPASGKTQDLLANHVATAREYHLCRAHHQGLTDWLRATAREAAK